MEGLDVCCALWGSAILTLPAWPRQRVREAGGTEIVWGSQGTFGQRLLRLMGRQWAGQKYLKPLWVLAGAESYRKHPWGPFLSAAGLLPILPGTHVLISPSGGLGPEGFKMKSTLSFTSRFWSCFITIET